MFQTKKTSFSLLRAILSLPPSSFSRALFFRFLAGRVSSDCRLSECVVIECLLGGLPESKSSFYSDIFYRVMGIHFSHRILIEKEAEGESLFMLCLAFERIGLPGGSRVERAWMVKQIHSLKSGQAEKGEGIFEKRGAVGTLLVQKTQEG